MKDGRLEVAFAVGPVRYSHWDFDPGRGWPSDFWLAEGSIEAPDYKAAVEWPMEERDALDILTLTSLIHRKLDRARKP